ncbi:hypothetical protein FS837_003423 [Tulasnella sp. UAMH 9824]|nr:hypothetical protein FS837_003423 [Tulasnella sp. UAMH 9824]
MSVDFEVMLCSFDDGVRFVSTLDLLPASKENWGPKLQPQTWNARRPSVAASRKPGNHIPPGPWDEPGLPDGWRGSLLPAHSIHFEVIHAGNRHDSAPGVNGVALDYSKLVSFFDPKYKSLVRSREGVDRTKWRVGEISKRDVGLFRRELVDTLRRKETGSGVKWDGIIKSVVERHAGRLEFLSDWLRGSRTNVTQTVVHARRAVLTMLTPYLAISSIPPDSKTNTTWLNPAMYHCSTAFTSHLPFPRLTPQERRLKHSVEIVMKEICRTLGVLWVDAFDAEQLDDEHEKLNLVAKWTIEVKKLMDWLGWAEWVKCKPTCSQYEMCSLPQWPYDARWMDPEPEISYTPKCMSRIEQDPGGPEWLS